MNKKAISIGLPDGWISIKLSDITLPITRTNKKYEDSNEEFKYIDIEAIDNSSQTIKELKNYKWGTAPSRAQQIVQNDDILFATVRPYLKNIAIISSQHNPVIASTGFCILRTIIVNPKYIFYYVSSQTFIDRVNQYAKGTSYPAVTNKIILDQKIPLTSLDGQNKIVDKIEEIFSELDNCRINLQNMQKQLKTYRQVILKNAFTGKLTEKWRQHNEQGTINTLLRVLEDERNKYYLQKLSYWESETAKRNLANSGNLGLIKPQPKLVSIKNKSLQKIKKISEQWQTVPLESIGELTSGQHILEKNHNSKQSGLAYLTGPSDFGNVYPTSSRWTNDPKVLSFPNDILITVKGSGVGKVNMMNFEGAIGRQIMAYRSYYKNKWFVYYFLLSNFRTIQELSSGTAIPGISREHILSLECPLISEAEQEIIVQEIRSQFSLIENLEKIITSSLHDLNLLKQSILDKAYHGKLIIGSTENVTADLEKIIKEKNNYHENKISTPKKMKTLKKSLIDILNEKFKNQEFTFEDIRNEVHLPYEEIKDQLFQLLDENTRLSSKFIKDNEAIIFKIKK